MVVPLAWMWNASRLPGSYSVTDMGYVDSGGGPTTAHHTGVPVSSLTGPAGAPDVRMTLTTRLEGKRYTVNGTSPGPLVAAAVGQLVEVTLVNDNVPDGVTLHWHGVDVPNAEDGVAGVTQDAVLPGQRHVYRWRAEHAGTYWYHSHQVSHTQVRQGLLGPLVIGGSPRDVVALLHLYDGKNTVNGRAADEYVAAEPGTRVRVRVINTDNAATPVWSTGSWTLLAVDGRDLHEPPPVEDRALQLTAGGRADLLVTAPARVSLGGSVTVSVGTPVDADPQPSAALDLLSYGTPAPLGFSADDPDRRFTYSIGRRPGFVDGRPGLWWSINGHLWPDVPMFLVAEGDVVFSPRLAGFVLDAFRDAPVTPSVDEDLDQLTPREREVLRLLARGYAYKEIASELFISVKTVETHASNVLRKLQLSSRHQLTRWAADRRML